MEPELFKKGAVTVPLYRVSLSVAADPLGGAVLKGAMALMDYTAACCLTHYGCRVIAILAILEQHHQGGVR